MSKLLSSRATLFSGTATASGDTYSTPIKTQWAKEAIFFFNITAASGTNETLDVVLEIQDRVTEEWFTLATFSQRTAVGSDVGYVQYGLGDRVAVNYTIGGTTPSFTFTVTANIKESY